MRNRLATDHPSNHLVPALSSFLTLALVLVGCGAPPESAEPDVSDSLSPTKIAWYEGDMESAFAYAESAGKPLFLYWGAEWCPPCHYLKNKIFTRPEFVARMQGFVPVYLDGDTARAQILGERLEVKGYPTVIIFDPLGQEVMRMPSTVAVDQYQRVLDTAVANLKPVKTVLAEVLSDGPAAATQKDLNLLAFYSWGQDSKVELSLDEQIEAFRRLYLETPETLPMERSRFLGLYLASLARQQSRAETAEPLLTADESKAFQAAVLDTLADPTLRNANLLWIDFYATAIIDLLQPQDGPGRQELLGAWHVAADAMETDSSLSVDDRLTATGLKIDLVTLAAHPEAEEVQIPADLQEHVRSRVSWALETVVDESELQTVVNTLAHLLDSADLGDEAEAMLVNRMDDTAAPYYFMSWVASLREDAGDTSGALEWYRKAYDASRGRYSRFRWGSTYLRRLMDLSPESAGQIEEDSMEVLTELLTQEDAFAGGNHSRLDSLQSAYWTWNADGNHEEVLARLRAFVHASCSGYPSAAGDSQRERCDSFLVPADIEGDAAM